MQNWTLHKIKKALKELSLDGFIISNRSHNTGIGKTLEDYLNINENNIALPDFGILELKSQRHDSKSMITLFTKSPDGIGNKEIRLRYGYPDKEFPHQKVVHQTIERGKKNRSGYHLNVNEEHDKLSVMKDEDEIGSYSLNYLKTKAIEKFGNGLVLVLAHAKKINDIEYFHYNEAYILKDIDPLELVKHSKFDIRLGVYHSGTLVGKLHDHGSAFRVSLKSLPLLFKKRKRIL